MPCQRLQACLDAAMLRDTEARPVDPPHVLCPHPCLPLLPLSETVVRAYAVQGEAKRGRETQRHTTTPTPPVSRPSSLRTTSSPHPAPFLLNRQQDEATPPAAPFFPPLPEEPRGDTPTPPSAPADHTEQPRDRERSRPLPNQRNRPGNASASSATAAARRARARTRSSGGPRRKRPARALHAGRDQPGRTPAPAAAALPPLTNGGGSRWSPSPGISQVRDRNRARGRVVRGQRESQLSSPHDMPRRAACPGGQTSNPPASGLRIGVSERTAEPVSRGLGGETGERASGDCEGCVVFGACKGKSIFSAYGCDETGGGRVVAGAWSASSQQRGLPRLFVEPQMVRRQSRHTRLMAACWAAGGGIGAARVVNPSTSRGVCVYCRV